MVGLRGVARLSGFVALLALCCATTGLAASSAMAARAGAVKACGYMVQTAGGTATEFIRVLDPAAPGARGTLAFKGIDAKRTSHVTLNNKGLALTSFPVAHPGSETMTVTLATKPATTRTFHFTLRPVASDAAAKRGCTPK
jgi:hypothetical protein